MTFVGNLHFSKGDVKYESSRVGEDLLLSELRSKLFREPCDFKYRKNHLLEQKSALLEPGVHLAGNDINISLCGRNIESSSMKSISSELGLQHLPKEEQICGYCVVALLALAETHGVKK